MTVWTCILGPWGERCPWERKEGNRIIVLTEKPAFPPQPLGSGVGGRGPRRLVSAQNIPKPFTLRPSIHLQIVSQAGWHFEVPTLMPPVPPSQFSLLNFPLFSSKPQRSTSSDRHMPTPVLSIPRPPSSLQVRRWGPYVHTLFKLNSTATTSLEAPSIGKSLPSSWGHR